MLQIIINDHSSIDMLGSALVLYDFFDGFEEVNHFKKDILAILSNKILDIKPPAQAHKGRRSIYNKTNFQAISIDLLK